MRFVSLNLDLSDIEALRHAVAAYLAADDHVEGTTDPVRTRLRLTLVELDAVLNRPAPRRLARPGDDLGNSAQESHLRLVHSVNSNPAVQPVPADGMQQ